MVNIHSGMRGLVITPIKNDSLIVAIQLERGEAGRRVNTNQLTLALNEENKPLEIPTELWDYYMRKGNVSWTGTNRATKNKFKNLSSQIETNQIA